MNVQSVTRFILALATLMSSPAFAQGTSPSAPSAPLTIGGVDILPTQLPSGCSLVEQERFVSIQAHTLYTMVDDPSMAKLLKVPPHKAMQTVQCGNDTGTVYYYEYGDLTDALHARSFAEGLIWGGNAPTPEHPELILAQGNMLVVVSSRTPDALRKLVRMQDMPKPQITQVSGEQNLGGGVLATFPATLKMITSTMPYGATNFRVYGHGVKVGITGLPTGKPRAAPSFVNDSVDKAGQHYAGSSRPFPPAQPWTTPKFNAARSSQCSDKAPYPVFPDASFACVAVMIISADQMVLIISVGTDTLDSDDYKAVMAALLAAH